MLFTPLQESRHQWGDDYKINQALRKRFREETKDDRIANKRLKERLGLDLRMKPTSKDDILTSSLVRFKTERRHYPLYSLCFYLKITSYKNNCRS